MAAFSKYMGDSAVSFPLTGTGKLDHVLIPFARGHTLARATFRPTSHSLPRGERHPSPASTI